MQNELHLAIYHNKYSSRGGLNLGDLKEILRKILPNEVSAIEHMNRGDVQNRFKMKEVLTEFQNHLQRSQGMHFDYRYSNDIVSSMSRFIINETEIVVLGENHGESNVAQLRCLLNTLDSETKFLVEAGPEEKGEGKSDSTHIDAALKFLYQDMSGIFQSASIHD